MEENNKAERVQPTPRKKFSTKQKAYFFLGLILVAAAVYSYIWYRQTDTLRRESLQMINQAKKYTQLRSAVETERTRCGNFIAQKEGDFSSFEYCKKFIDWASTLPASQ